ncbi:MAG: VOC family protein, partial [Ktedonobacteraceae bacterium]
IQRELYLVFYEQREEIMTQNPQAEKPTLFPYLVYRDAGTAFNWLANVFGFRKTAEVLGPDGNILHAEMSFGAGVIMLGTASDEQLEQSPGNLPSGHGIYVYVEDLDTHYERARASGAKIVYPPENTQWGTRRYRALDLDGYEWSFGTYRPSGEEK